MANMTIWAWAALAIVALSFTNAMIARWKNRSMTLWFILGLMFNPISFIVLLCLPTRSRATYWPQGFAEEDYGRRIE